MLKPYLLVSLLAEHVYSFSFPIQTSKGNVTLDQAWHLNSTSPYLFPGYIASRSTAALTNMSLMGYVTLRNYEDNGNYEIWVSVKNVEEACKYPKAGVPYSCAAMLKVDSACETSTANLYDKTLYNHTTNPWVQGSKAVLSKQDPDRSPETRSCKSLNGTSVTCAYLYASRSTQANVSNADVQGQSALVFYDYNGEPSNCLPVAPKPRGSCQEEYDKFWPITCRNDDVEHEDGRCKTLFEEAFPDCKNNDEDSWSAARSDSQVLQATVVSAVFYWLLQNF